MGEALTRRLDDGRTVGFGDNPMADLSDIHQRMAFALKAGSERPNAKPVARGLAPAGARSGPKNCKGVVSGTPHSLTLRLLRSRTGRCGVPTSPLATNAREGRYAVSHCKSAFEHRHGVGRQLALNEVEETLNAQRQLRISVVHRVDRLAIATIGFGQ